MQDQNPASDIVKDMEKARKVLSQNAADSNIVDSIVDKITNARNILIAMSSDPSTEELAGAIGMSIFLDKIGKHITTIYSGKIPKMLEFLEPERYFAESPEAVQDFVISVNKDKADYLRYKVEGDDVKIYITPYKTRLSQSDLEYSYGDYNVELVLALNVMNIIDLDNSLREHGLIMQNATTVNITTSKPGKFGEIEWSNTKASSVSEMLAEIVYAMDSQAAVTKEDATAFLTGIVAATNRFSNARTTSGAMDMASKLLKSNANQLLISQNISAEPDGVLSIDMREVEAETDSLSTDKQNQEVNLNIKKLNQVNTENAKEESQMDDDLAAVKAELTEDSNIEEEIPQLIGPQIPTPGSSLPKVEVPVEEQPEKVELKPTEPEPNQYGKMLEEALNSTVNAAEKQFTEAVVAQSEAVPAAPKENEILPPPPAPPVSANTYMPPVSAQMENSTLPTVSAAPAAPAPVATSAVPAV